MTGHQYFKYVAIPYVDLRTPTSVQANTKFFTEVREWMWETYGPSCEREYYMQLAGNGYNVNPAWCWHSDYGERKIFMVDDKTRDWFTLKWI